ncbi:JAB domain-containing protein [Paraburkholderia agricolaris]|jgi:DNA repair protein RadC|uniref:JAB domain-containing protein n=1 Tax=Paraburkholderia agricolaris TaxID=2152888 RepID=A0ABW8ZKR2_9BURK
MFDSSDHERCIVHDALAHAFSPDNSTVVDRAIRHIEARIFRRNGLLCSPEDVHDYVRLKLAGEPAEIFAAVFLDARQQVIAWEPLFRGTIDTCSIHSRVVLQRALAHNCAAIILVHNHPSGCSDPSPADRRITQVLKELLEPVDIRVLDHLIVGEGLPFSFSQHGLL